MRVKPFMSAAIVAAVLMSTSVARTPLAQASGLHPVASNAACVQGSCSAYDTPELALVPGAPTLAAPDMVAGFTVRVAPTGPGHFAASRPSGRAPPLV